MFYTCYRAFLSGFSGHGNEEEWRERTGWWLQSDSQGVLCCQSCFCLWWWFQRSSPLSLFRFWNCECFIPAGNTGTPMAFPEEKRDAVQRKAHPQHFCAPWGFPVLPSETWGPCYLSISAFDVIGALAGRLSVEPGTRCAAWKTKEPSHHLLARGRLCASRRTSG